MEFWNRITSDLSSQSLLFIGVVTAILLLFKRWYEIKHLNITMKNAKSASLLQLLSSDIEKLSKLRVEVTFREYLGVMISFDEIKLLNNGKFPFQNFQDYKYGKQHFAFDGEKGFSNTSLISLTVRKIIANIVFGLCPGIFLFTILFLAASIATSFNFEHIATGIVGVLSSIALFIWAINELRSATSAERLLKSFPSEKKNDCDESEAKAIDARASSS